MTFLLHIIPLVFITLSIVYILRVRRSLDWIKHFHVEARESPGVKIAIFIPVYDEISIIDETVEFFNAVSKALLINVYYITTSKEGGPTYNQTEQKIVKRINSLSHVIHYPKKYGAKASQLNYALNHLHDTYDYIAVFDADSRPDIGAFRYILSDDSRPDIYQMPSAYCLNIEGLPLLERANAIFQTRWTMGYEIPQWRAWQKDYTKPPLMYTVGHGLFINTKRFTKPLFHENTIAEDIWFGYVASGTHRTIKVVPFLDYCSVPPSTLGVVKQTARWFSGELRMISLRKDLFKIRSKQIQSLALIIKRYFEIFLWPFGPLLVLASLICAAVNHDILLLFEAVVGIYLYVIAAHRDVAKKILSRKPSWREYFALLIKSFINCLGPLLGIYQFIVSNIVKKEVAFIKTSRLPKH